ncbi:MAG: Rrf2 family transcriptional regulator [Coriobacteriales bacterium]|nr:Rrf2 family transcriptional regulator [Coriobacteriales bacterium]
MTGRLWPGVDCLDNQGEKLEISRRTDYAIRLMAALLKNAGRPLSVKEAAQMQDVPYSFARSIQHELTKHGMVKTVRGARGGMILAVDPKTLTLLEFIEVFQGPVSVAICLSEPGWCPRDGCCEFHEIWGGASQLLKDYLGSMTFSDILDGKTVFAGGIQREN